MGGDLDSGGAELVETLSAPTDSAEMRALITESARIKDRLDRLDRILGGDEELWARLVASRGGEQILEIRIDGALTEARQQATVFRQLLAEIARRRKEDSPRDDDDPLDDL